MKKKTRRDTILHVYIEKKNNIWLKKQLKKYGYSATRGKSQFVNDLITTATHARRAVA